MKTAFFEVFVAGSNITTVLAPVVQSIEVTLNEGTHSDTASIEVDDRDAQIILPSVGAAVIIFFGWEGSASVEVFKGKVETIRSRGNRSGGMQLTVTAKGLDTLSKCKEPQQLHIDKAKVGDALNKAGEIAGVTVKVAPELANIEREWWGLNDESFVAFGERVAEEVGGTFKLRDKEAVLVPKEGGTASGKSIPTFSAARGVNLTDWDIEPTTGRPRFKKTFGRHFDIAGAEWKEEEEDVEEEEDTDARLADRHPRLDSDQTKRKAKSRGKDAKKERGGGSADVDGSASPQPGGMCSIAGARPGVDGEYRISSVRHKYDRSGGWVTALSLKMPGGSAGKDSRRKKK